MERGRGGAVEKRRRVMEGIMTEELGRKIEISEVRKRKGTASTVLIVSMGKRKELLKKVWEIRRNWEIGVDEDLIMEERKVRWKLVEKARMERVKGVVVTTNRRIWINGKAWG